MIEEVKEFARLYVNFPRERTAERNQKIRIAYREMYGKSMPGSCRTCYIEAILKITNYKAMTKNYELKRGVLLQEFGFPTKACTNLTLTDELAQWHLARHPEKAVLFSKIPGTTGIPVHIIPPKITIIPPVEKGPEVSEVANQIIGSFTTAEPQKKQRKPRK
jgi:hypothetical protein